MDGPLQLLDGQALQRGAAQLTGGRRQRHDRRHAHDERPGAPSRFAPGRRVLDDDAAVRADVEHARGEEVAVRVRFPVVDHRPGDERVECVGGPDHLESGLDEAGLAGRDDGVRDAGGAHPLQQLQYAGHGPAGCAQAAHDDAGDLIVDAPGGQRRVDAVLDEPVAHRTARGRPGGPGVAAGLLGRPWRAMAGHVLGLGVEPHRFGVDQGAVEVPQHRLEGARTVRIGRVG